MSVALLIFLIVIFVDTLIHDFLDSEIIVIYCIVSAIIFLKMFISSIKKHRRVIKQNNITDLGELNFKYESDSPAPPDFKNYNGAGYLAYQYQCVWFSLCTSSISESYVHKPIEFFRDADGISVRCDSKKIGVLNPHKITDMISDWLDREESYCAYLTTIFTDTMEASFNIAFYRDELANAFRKYDEYKEFKLNGNRTGEILETAELSNEGEKCTVDYDPAHDKYAVYDEHSNIMGFLPSAGVKYYQDHDEECVGFVSRVEYDDVDHHVILYVTLFAK